MEKMLLNLAKRLNAYDEASLMALWEKYAAQVRRFEPTKRWEEATVVFAFIQALRWKNQLFNHQWAEQVRPKLGEAPRLVSESAKEDRRFLEEDRPMLVEAKRKKKTAKVLPFVFKPKTEDNPPPDAD